MIHTYRRVFFLILLVYGSMKECIANCYYCHDHPCRTCEPSYYVNNGFCCKCPGNCEKCLSLENCTQCKYGFYGYQCNQNCNLCLGGLCNLSACQFGCKPGFFLTSQGRCDECSHNCEHCESREKCSVCNEGFYLRKYHGDKFDCLNCSLNADSCQTNCEIENCKICKVDGYSKHCIICKQNYKYSGEKCVHFKKECSAGCLTYCDLSGTCIGNCTDGWTGERCIDPCPDKCLKCNKKNKNLCQKCKNGYYTSSCNKKCSLSCKKVPDESTCRFSNGYCEHGCEKNLWGSLCNKSCPSNCAYPSDSSPRCFRNNGSCSNGCIRGFEGLECENPVFSPGSKSSSKVTQKESEPSQVYTMESTTDYVGEILETSRQDNSLNIVLIGPIAGGGAVLVIVTFVVIAWLAKRRRKLLQAGNENRRGEVDNERAGSNVNLQCVTPGSEDCLYAQVNKMNKRNNGTKAEPQMATRDVVFDLEVKEVVMDDTDLEEIEDVNISSSEADVNIPTPDTYYNTASLFRSRIDVSNLCEDTKNKSDYKKEFESLPVGLTRACTEGLKQKNRAKNRYNGIYAYDATRVVLKSGNYVNANFIDGHKKYPAYIASLGPTKSTMNNFATFWEMIWQEKTYNIMMLTNLDESKKMKCEQYWPAQGNENNYGDYKVRCTAEKVFSEFIVREFTVARGKETREVTQYQYTAWPDKTVPDSVASLLEFRDKVEQKQLSTAGPMMVHCSAGIGRTGTYIALDILIKEGKDDHSVDIFGCVNALRGQRVHLVQNLEQYVYLHYCVLYALSCAPEPLPVSTMAHFTSDDRLSAQHKAFVSLQHLTNRDKKMGTKNVTRKENRTGADIPDDKHRVRLGLIEKDYINAVYVNGYQEYNKFILAQTPLQGTLEDFASMLYQEQCSCVVCLDDENVIDKSIVQYLPSVNKVVTFGQFQLICTDIDRKQDFISRKLKVSRIGVSLSEEVSVFHYQFKGWSSIDCVPRSIQSFLNLVTDVEKTYQSPNSKHPIVVHCSTGAERSGLFCAVSILLEKVAVEKEVSVLNTVCQVCSRRRSAFQDIEHLRFCYSCVEQMSEVSESSTYYNSRNM